MSLSRRKFNKHLLAALSLGTLHASIPLLARADLVKGRDWVPIDPPQPGESPGKIEVLEFFSYGCPHCGDLNPLIHPWAQNLPDDVAFRRVPVSFGRAAWANLGRLYFSLEATGDLQRLDQPVFDALHKQRIKLYTEPAILDWLAKQGVDTKAFAEIFNSFDVQTQMSRSDYLVKRYRIDAVPRLTVAGRYQVVGHAVQSLPELLTITDQLVALARAEQAANPHN